MKLYDQFFNVVKKFRQLFSGGPARNSDVSGSITAEILIIVSFLLLIFSVLVNKAHESFISRYCCYIGWCFISC